MKRAEKNETVVENAANDEAAKAEFDAAATAKETDTSDPWYSVFTVDAKTVANSPALKTFGEDVQFTVTRTRKGNYIASNGEVTGGDGRKAETAINKCIAQMGGRKEEFIFDAKAAEPEIPTDAGGNQPTETWFFDDAGNPLGAALDSVRVEVEAADRKLSGAAVDTRDGWLGFGRAYNKAKLIFADAGLIVQSADGKSETAKRGNKAWGTWLETRFGGVESITKILESKNAANQAGFYASAPDEVVKAFPDVNTASTFERKTNEIVQAFAKSVVEIALNNRTEANNESTEFDSAEAMATAIRKQDANVKTYDTAFKQWQDDAAAAGEKGKTPKPFANARDKAGNTVIAWLLSDADLHGKLDAALAKAWEVKIGEPTEEEAEEEAAKKATAAITKKFAEMTVEAAAMHLLAILVSHAEAEEVYATLGDKLEDAIAAKAKAAADAKANAEKEAAEA